MKNKDYMDALARHQEIPSGLDTYLSVALQEYKFCKNDSFSPCLHDDLYIPCIVKGLAMLIAHNYKRNEMWVLEFYSEGDFLPSILNSKPVLDIDLQIQFLEETTLLAVNEKHYCFLPKIFPSISLHYKNIYEADRLKQINREIINKTTLKSNRLNAFKRWRPLLSNRLEERYLTSYLKLSNQQGLIEIEATNDNHR